MKLITYIKDTRAELKHVSWPTRRQALWFTGVVIAISLVTAAYLGLLDHIFGWILERILV